MKMYFLGILLAILLFAGVETVAIATNPKIKALAEAIARAEGFYAGGDTVPKRANNPGDLKNGNAGLGNIGGKTVYATAALGWAALYRQLNLIMTGKSKYYTLDNTFLEFAETYTGKDAAASWAKTVTQALGVSTDTTLGEYFS